MLTQDRPQIQMQPISRQPSSHRHRLSIVVTKDVVKVRDGASTDAKELGLLKEQVTLTAYGTEETGL